jgi:hypothetical protein
MQNLTRVCCHFSPHSYVIKKHEDFEEGYYKGLIPWEFLKNLMGCSILQ